MACRIAVLGRPISMRVFSCDLVALECRAVGMLLVSTPSLEIGPDSSETYPGTDRT